MVAGPRPAPARTRCCLCREPVDQCWVMIPGYGEAHHACLDNAVRQFDMARQPVQLIADEIERRLTRPA